MKDSSIKVAHKLLGVDMTKTNIIDILDKCRPGIQLYSPVCGSCTLAEIKHKRQVAMSKIIVEPDNGMDKRKMSKIISFNYAGQLSAVPTYVHPDGECLLWPSQSHKNWDDVVVINGRIYVNPNHS